MDLKIDFTIDELQVLFAVITQKEFKLGDLVILNPIAVKMQIYLEANKPAEQPKSVETPTVESISKPKKTN